MDRRLMVNTMGGRKFPMLLNKSVQESPLIEGIKASILKEFPNFVDRLQPNKNVLVRDVSAGLEYIVNSETVFAKEWFYKGTEFCLIKAGRLNELTEFTGSVIEIENGKMKIYTM